MVRAFEGQYKCFQSTIRIAIIIGTYIFLQNMNNVTAVYQYMDSVYNYI